MTDECSVPRKLFLSDREVAERLGVARSSVWRAVHHEPGFPKPVRLLGRRIGWHAHEIEAWSSTRERAH